MEWSTAHDPGLARVLRDDPSDLPVRARKMFGGLCFPLNGHMICGSLKDCAYYRVGKPNMTTAFTGFGTHLMTMAGRDMQGFVELKAAHLEDPARRAPLLAFALGFVTSLPPK